MQKFIHLNCLLKRNSSNLAYKGLPSKLIRQQFLNYFIAGNDHKLIRSSPVVPFCDPTVAFVNAGMNQFKNVFLGTLNPPCKRAVNSQKCVRVGGKHNDLSLVGTDGYHHTFFEMLGNWSFGDYFKQEACSMAWNLLKDVYNIDTRRLYVTYFKGDKILGIPPDTECQEIWRSIGVPDQRILPFGIKENFWEMGATGPCGPCTEIHIDHVPQYNGHDRAKYVNRDRPDLTELWNIVFIQYNRCLDGSITRLPQHHIDTGMGFERLVAILQNGKSNYDTDLFIPLFETISKSSKAPSYNFSFNKNESSFVLDTAYRILADHSRMITACLADGMFPDQNHKLRRVLRKAILISERSFKQKKLLYEVIPKVVELLGDTYPEMEKNFNQILQIVFHEDEIFSALRKNTTNDIKLILEKHPSLEEFDLIESPGFILGFKELEKSQLNMENIGEISFKLYDTYGIDLDTIDNLLKLFHLTFDKNEFEKFMIVTRKRTVSTFTSFNANQSTQDKANLLNLFKIKNINKTENHFKYDYEYNEHTGLYFVKKINAHIIGILNEQYEIKDQIYGKGRYYLLVDKSNFYYESGGQDSDSGVILMKNNNVHMDVQYIENIDGYLLHAIDVNSTNNNNIIVGDKIEMIVNNELRTENIFNHTATHLLNAAVRSVANCPVCQKSSSVKNTGLKLELGVFGTKLERTKFEEIEVLIRNLIKAAIQINKYEITSQQLLEIDDITLVPGEVYPDKNLQVIEIMNDNKIKFLSRELCCGTHARNTKDLIDFCITNVKLGARGGYIINAIAGESALQAHTLGSHILEDVLKIKSGLENGIEQIDDLEIRTKRMKSLLMNSPDSLIIPYTIKTKCLEIFNSINKHIKDLTKIHLKELVDIEMKNVIEQNKTAKFITHFLVSSSLMETVPLDKATKFCQDRPILIISLSGDLVKARSCVPKQYINSNFDAQKWISVIAKIFKSEYSLKKGQQIQEICNLKNKKIKAAVFEEQLEDAMSKANEFAETNM